MSRASRRERWQTRSQFERASAFIVKVRRERVEKQQMEISENAVQDKLEHKLKLRDE
jgi:hypothetical protein